MKVVKAVAPYIHPEFLNFKSAAYEAWKRCEGNTAEAHYPIRMLHGLAFRYEMPTLWNNNKEARLRFIEPVSVSFDTFPDYALYEIIPFVWDCWPCYFEKMCLWLQKHQVRTAIFTSSQTAERMQARFPKMNILHCPEGIDESIYLEGKQLKERAIDFLEYGRNTDRIVKYDYHNLKVIRGQKDGKNTLSFKDLLATIQNAKIVAAYPKNWTDPEKAGGIETLTQRYWECMLSRCVMIGHAPKELIDLIGYNPVIEIDLSDPDKQLRNILTSIGNYQGLVDKNRVTALRLGNWETRMKQLRAWLYLIGYES